MWFARLNKDLAKSVRVRIEPHRQRQTTPGALHAEQHGGRLNFFLSVSIFSVLTVVSV